MNTKPCRECSAPMIFLKTAAGKFEPVNPDSLSDADKYEIDRGLKIPFDPKRHVSHFSTCPKADKFRKPKVEPQKSFFETD